MYTNLQSLYSTITNNNNNNNYTIRNYIEKYNNNHILDRAYYLWYDDVKKNKLLLSDKEYYF